MARGLTTPVERRGVARVAPEAMSWPRAARLRPDQDILIVNLSSGGALVESPTSLKPGARADLQRPGAERTIVRGRIARCRVIGLEPMQYEAAILFEQPLDALGSE